MLDENFGLQLREVRRELGLSQEALAERVDATQKQVGRWERAEQEPKFDTLRHIARALGVPVGRLLEEEE